MNSSTAAFVGSIPEKYEEHLGPLLFEPYAVDLVARIDTKNIKNVLEIACGTGRVTYHLCNLLPPSLKLVVTDLNPDMISMAQAKLKDKNIEWKVADAQELPFDNESFDLVVCQFGYMFVPDKTGAFTEAYRVLRKGGRLLFNTWDKIENNGAPAVTNEVINAVFENDPPVFYQVPFSMHDPKEIESLLKNAGFKNIKIELVKKEGKSSSALHAAIGFVEGNPVYEEIIKKDPALVAVVREQIKKKLAQKYGDSPMICPLQAFVCECEK